LIIRLRYGISALLNLLWLLTFTSVSTSHCQAPITADTATSNGPRLYGERVTLALAIVKGYPFLEGSINGKAGKLLLDTGDWRAFDINNHTVIQAGGISVGRGAFGSGQTFDVMRYPVVNELNSTSRRSRTSAVIQACLWNQTLLRTLSVGSVWISGQDTSQRSTMRNLK